MARSNLYQANLIEDPMDPRLHVKSDTVKNPRDPEIILLVQRMKEIQKSVNGVGLAACQIGINKRVITVLDERDGKIYEFINPRIVDAEQIDDNVYWHEEGCLSHPGIYGEVARYRHITFVAYRLSSPREFQLSATGIISRIIQHEIDHTNGLLYTDLGPEVRNIRMDMAGQEKLMRIEKNRTEDYVQPQITGM